MMSVEGVQEIASSLGAIKQIDLENLNDYDVVRFLVDVKDPDKIPDKFEFGQPPYLYDVFFTLEAIAVQGGLMPGYTRVATPGPSKRKPGGAEDNRQPKKPKSDNQPGGQQDPGTEKESDNGGKVNALGGQNGPADSLQSKINGAATLLNQQEGGGEISARKSIEDTIGDSCSAMAVDDTSTKAGNNGTGIKDRGRFHVTDSEGDTLSTSTPFEIACGLKPDQIADQPVEMEDEVPQQQKMGHRRNKGVGNEDKREPRRCARFSGQEDISRVEKALERAKFKDLTTAPGTAAEEEKR